MENIEETVKRFREAAIGNAALDPTEANRWHDIGRSCYKILQETEEGRKAMMSLMDDEDPIVRSCAAARCLQWNTEKARRVLEEVRDADGPGAFGAKWTLIEFEKGNLRFDY